MPRHAHYLTLEQARNRVFQRIYGRRIRHGQNSSRRDEDKFLAELSTTWDEVHSAESRLRSALECGMLHAAFLTAHVELEIKLEPSEWKGAAIHPRPFVGPFRSATGSKAAQFNGRMPYISREKFDQWIKATLGRSRPRVMRVAPSPVGRPREYDWLKFDEEAFRLLVAHREPSSSSGRRNWKKFADFKREMMQWCIDNWDDGPSWTSLSDRLVSVRERYRKSNTGRSVISD